MAWQLTKGLDNLRDQVNEAFPDRDKASDGTVGDLAHQGGASGHNPDRTGNAEYKDGDSLDEVRAWDMDTDLRAAPATAQQVVDHIRRLPGVSSVLRYMIYNRKIYQAPGWSAADYDGPSPHTEHIHFSGARTQASDNNTSFDFRLEEIPVALTSADKQWLDDLLDRKLAAERDDQAKATWDYREPDPSDPDGTRRVGADVAFMEKRRREMEERIGIELTAMNAELKTELLAAIAKLKPTA